MIGYDTDAIKSSGKKRPSINRFYHVSRKSLTNHAIDKLLDEDDKDSVASGSSKSYRESIYDFDVDVFHISIPSYIDSFKIDTNTLLDTKV